MPSRRKDESESEYSERRKAYARAYALLRKAAPRRGAKPAAKSARGGKPPACDVQADLFEAARTASAVSSAVGLSRWWD